jgi:hypothetical protein
VNYYDARKLEDGSGWHYTSANRRLGTSPVGFCAQWHEDKSHVHETEEEARECFRKYLISEITEVDYSDWTGCEVCDTPTKKGMKGVGGIGPSYSLCDEHRTAEQVDKLTEAPGQIVASY